MVNIRILSLQLFVGSIYIVLSYLYTIDLVPISDTLEYYRNFKNINSVPYPYGIEFVIPLIMSFFEGFGLEFNDFLFFIVIAWLPVVFILVREFDKRPLIFFSICFFMLGYFHDMVIFLVRSYFALLLFLLFLFLKSRIRYVFLFLSIFSHLSIVILLIFYSILIYEHILRRRTLAFIILLTATLLSGGSTEFIFSNLDFGLINHFFGDDITRKFMYYSVNNESNNSIGLLRILILWCVGVLVIMNNPTDSKYKKINSIIFFQVVFGLLFSGNAVAASRFGLVTFYFYIPLVFIYIHHNFIEVIYYGKGNRDINA